MTTAAASDPASPTSRAGGSRPSSGVRRSSWPRSRSSAPAAMRARPRTRSHGRPSVSQPYVVRLFGSKEKPLPRHDRVRAGSAARLLPDGARGLRRGRRAAPGQAHRGGVRRSHRGARPASDPRARLPARQQPGDRGPPRDRGSRRCGASSATTWAWTPTRRAPSSPRAC